ncbi:MAG TPA: phage tail length tape measure family protein, partial [Pseudoxanthomonas sp.]|nr:phage tail length tape measure family protein [Pseudoxanthomonas sp.]
MESINKAAKDSAATAKKAGDDWYEFGEKIGQGIRYAGVTAAAGIGLILKNSIDAEKELSQLDAVLQSTGLAASYSRDQMVALAEGIAQASTYSAGEIVKAETRLLSYSGIVGEVFPEALQIAIDQAARLGIGVEQSAETIGRALESPTKAAAALAQQGFGAAFTDSVRKSIQALEDAGDTAGAQRIVIDILKESYEGAALAARNTLGGAAEALINTLADLTTGSDGSLEGATAAVNDLIDTLNDPSVREGFATIVNGVASITAELVEGIAKLASWMAQVREINGLASGGLQPGDAQYENLNARLGQAATERRDLQGWTGYKSAGQEEFRQQQIAKLDQEIAALQREITS